MAEANVVYALVGENGQYSDPVFETIAEAEAHRGPAQDVIAVENGRARGLTVLEARERDRAVAS